VDRLAGIDATLLHMERADTPMHTLKVVVLDTAVRGAPLTLADLHQAVEPYLGLVSRSTQRVRTILGAGGRPFWDDDPRFDLGQHLEETILPAPGGGTELDALCASLAERHLRRDRPLWAMTLVHGLGGGRQAVVVRVHHAVADGVAALNVFMASTSPEPGATPEPRPASQPGPAGTRTLRRTVMRQALGWLSGLGHIARIGRRNRGVVSSFADRVHVPPFFGARRTSFNSRSGSRRVCATTHLDLDDLKRVGRATGAPLNGVFHAVIAGAMREELVARGEACDEPLVATFGVSGDRSEDRFSGNAIATASVYLHTEIADPMDRLRETARSCVVGVQLRREVGFELTERVMSYTARIGPRLRSLFADVSPRVVNHITTANVAGPDHRRWFGDVEVVDWISFAVAIAPTDVNLTAYSYDGQLSLGLVATPESMPDPSVFLARLRLALHDVLNEMPQEPRND
jgi:diacylglycerol O-acyltransferase